MVATINADTTNGVVITSDTSGEIELQANGVTKAKVTANGLQDGNGNSLRGGSYRNLLINGDMRIAQRGTSATGLTSSGYYTVDRYRIAHNIGTFTMSQDTDVPSAQGFGNSLKMNCTTSSSLSASSILAITARLEGQNLQHLKKGTANAESVTLSFWVKSNKTGTYIAELFDNDNTRSISKSYTIDTANTWEKKTLTYVGDTTGLLDNDNDHSLQIYWWLAAGSNYTSAGTLNTSWASTITSDRAVGQVNLADSTSNYINITGVQLEVGSGASDFEHLPYDVQLQRCERYYQLLGAGMTGFMISATDMSLASTLRTVMRTAPSVTNAVSGTVYAQGTSVTASSTAVTVVTNNASIDGIRMRLGGWTGGGTSQPCTVYNSPVVGLSAEL